MALDLPSVTRDELGKAIALTVGRSAAHGRSGRSDPLRHDLFLGETAQKPRALGERRTFIDVS